MAVDNWMMAWILGFFECWHYRIFDSNDHYNDTANRFCFERTLWRYSYGNGDIFYGSNTHERKSGASLGERGESKQST